jgi:four helix bundle protein
MENENGKGLQSLLVWERAMEFCIKICKETLPQFPDHEKYALTSQLRRSAQSVPANIAEGYGRYYYQESVRFAYIARGSLEETNSHLFFAREMGYISDEEFKRAVSRISELNRMINGYISYLKRSKKGINEPGSGYIVEKQQDTLQDPVP